MSKKKKLPKRYNEKIISIVFLIALGLFSIILFWSYHVSVKSNLESFSLLTKIDSFFFPTQTFSDNSINYKFQYPADWQSAEINTETKLVTAKQLSSEENNATISITQYSQDGKKLIEWIKDLGKLPLLEEDKTEIDEITGMYLRLKNDKSTHSMLAYVPKNDIIYEIKIIYPIDDNFGYYKKVYNKLIQSFEFQ